MADLSKDYVVQQNILQLFESLLTGLVYHRPNDPITFIQHCLNEVKERDSQHEGYGWNCFITAVKETTSRSVFSRTKPLPPINNTLPVGDKSINKPMVFILGGPGCGKGTQCERLVSEFSLTHLSSGDLLREEVASGSQQGNIIQKLMKEGKLVPPDVTISLLKTAIHSRPDAIGFLIDGFPRELSQAYLFEEQVYECSMVVVFECSEDIMLERLRRRGITSGRVDDNDITIRKRLATFTHSTLPVINYYQKQLKLKQVNADQNVDDVYIQVREIFRHHINTFPTN